MIDQIKKQITDLQPCVRGLKDLKQAKSIEELVDLYFKYIDWIFENNYHPQITGLWSHGIIHNQKLVLNSPARVSVTGKSDVEIWLLNYDVCRIHVKDYSTTIIRASGNAVVVVDALPHSNVMCVVTGNGRVTVNQFNEASVTGASKINRINASGYDLQIKRD